MRFDLSEVKLLFQNYPSLHSVLREPLDTPSNPPVLIISIGFSSSRQGFQSVSIPIEFCTH